MKRFVAPLMVGLLVMAHGGYSQETSQGREPGGAHPQQARPTTPAPSDEARILRAQLEQMRDTDQRLLSTVHWSLGTLALTAALLVGFNLYVNLRQYEKDKTILAREITEMVTNTIRVKLEEAHGTLVKEVAKHEAALEIRITTSADSLRNGLLELQYQQLGMEADSWAQKRIYANCIIVRKNQLQLATQLANTYHINDTLQHIVDSLKLMVKEARALAPTTSLNDLVAILKTLSPDHQISVRVVEALIEETMKLPNGSRSAP